MKKFLNTVLGVIALSLLLVGLPQTKAAAAPQVSVSFQMFYDDLAPYGQWIDDPQYGYVWAPQLGNDFRPYYSGGHWVMTEYGNTWVSDYDWGWAPFHYGRWTYDNYYGWVWIPGDEWGPAWVSWRSGGGYYGWAPLGPGMGINISIGNYYMPYDWWTFIPSQYIYSRNYSSYWRGPGYNTTYYNQTTIINNYYNNRYAYGPRRNDVERYTGGRVTVYDIRNERSPRGTNINRNTVNIYRPQVARTGNRGMAPRNVVRAERPINTPGHSNARNERPERVINSNNNRAERVERPAMDRAQQQTGRNRGTFERADNDRRVQQQRQQAERENAAQQQRQEMIERQNAQRNEAARQQREQQMQRQNEQRIQQERAQRDNQVREQQMQRQQQMQAERQQQMQRQQIQRQQVERQQMQRQQAERQQQIQRQQQQVERQQQQRQQMERPQREWRRPEPQMQRQKNRIERQPQQQQRTTPDRGHFGRGR